MTIVVYFAAFLVLFLIFFGIAFGIMWARGDIKFGKKKKNRG